MDSCIGIPAEPCWRFPKATATVAMVTVAVYLLQHLHPGGIRGAIDQLGLNPALVSGGGDLPGTALPAWLGLITAAFMHTTWTHLGANMWILAVLGSGLEQVLGGRRLAVLYVLCAVLGNLGVALTLPDSDVAACGASVAVAGVWAAWLILARSSLAGTMLLFKSPSSAVSISRRLTIAAVVFTIVAAAWGWFGYKLIAMFTGAGLRVFWSIGFCAHLYGASIGVLLAVMLKCTWLKRHSARH